ncbi:MAG: dTMP kinase [Thermodesulfobacteriota bacterium]
MTTADKTALFVTLEGIEGSGKSTQMCHLARYFEDRGRCCVVTKEPGGTVIGEKIRRILLDPDHRGLDAMAELLLYTADRAQHVSECIRPALTAGKTVICDRFLDSTVVYQGAARGIDADTILEINRRVLAGIAPDVTFLLDLPPEIGLSRAWKEIDSGGRDRGQSRFEQERIQFHEKVRQGYQRIAAEAPERFCVIDASRDAEAVWAEMAGQLRRFIPETAV